MDNISRFYRAEYLRARKHAVDGEIEKCLDILWEMRLESQLSLFRRAMVNILIASVADTKKHPNLEEIAQEGIT